MEGCQYIISQKWYNVIIMVHPPPHANTCGAACLDLWFQRRYFAYLKRKKKSLLFNDFYLKEAFPDVIL